MRTSVLNGGAAEDRLLAALRGGLESTVPGKIALGQEHPEKGLAKLVLTWIELLRRLCEKQALRRVEAPDRPATVQGGSGGGTLVSVDSVIPGIVPEATWKGIL